jgi:hypothetical protein
MATDFTWLLECIDTQSPGDITVEVGQATATLFFIIKDKDLQKVFSDVLGYCVFNDKQWAINVQGGFNRKVEMSHPYMPAYTADSIDIIGVSPNGKVASDDFTQPALEYANQIFQLSNPDPQEQVDYRTVPYFAVYKYYRIAVNFSAKSYFPLTDEQLEPIILQGQPTPPEYKYYIRTQTPPYTRVQRYRDYREMLRYCTVEAQPTFSIITNQNGRLFWKDVPVGKLEPEGGGPALETPVTVENANTKFVTVCQSRFTVTWFKVPRETLLNPQYAEAFGQLNYGPNSYEDPGDTTIWNYELFNWAPGTMLLTGVDYEMQSVNSSFPTLPYSSKTRNDMFRNVLKNQYINIKFDFLQFVLPDDIVVKPRIESFANQFSGKMATNGWNFFPNGNKLWYYSESNTIANKEISWPAYFSFPMQRLFDAQAGL